MAGSVPEVSSISRPLGGAARGSAGEPGWSDAVSCCETLGTSEVWHQGGWHLGRLLAPPCPAQPCALCQRLGPQPGTPIPLSPSTDVTEFLL